MSSTRRRKQTNPQHIAANININNNNAGINDENVLNNPSVCPPIGGPQQQQLCGGDSAALRAVNAAVVAASASAADHLHTSSSEEDEEDHNNLLLVNNALKSAVNRENGPLSSSEDESSTAVSSSGVRAPAAVVPGSGDEHICGRCRGEFLDLASFLAHKKHCGRKNVLLVDEQVAPAAAANVPPTTPPNANLYAAAIAVAAAMQLDHHHNAVDKNRLLDTSVAKSEVSVKLEDEDSASSVATTTPPPNVVSKVEDENEEFEPFAYPYDSNVLLQSLPNTKVAVSQISACAAALNAICAGANATGDRMSPSTDSSSPLTSAAAASLMNSQATSELVMLQSTLYSLQQQQMLQLQLIQQLQQQLTTTSSTSPCSPSASVIATNGTSNSGTLNTNTAPSVTTSVGQPTTVSSIDPSPTHLHHQAHRLVITPPSASAPLNLVNHCSVPTTPTTPSTSQPLSSSVSVTVGSSLLGNLSVINTNSVLSGNAVLSPDDVKEPTNSLELLQRSAQQVLNNASQGLLTADLHFRSGSSTSRSGGPKSGGSLDSKSGFSRHDDGFFKHRCRYCGKVFGSDSALQIHIRSHTGERPFKCNVCGNRFSTKGNLKVHFQRHRAKYPHVKMNPNPVPEHMDKYGPPPLQPPSPVGGASAPSIQHSLQPPPSLLAMTSHHFNNTSFISSSPLTNFRSNSLDTGQFHPLPFLSRGGHDAQPSVSALVPHPIPLYNHSSMDRHVPCPQKPIDDEQCSLNNIKSELRRENSGSFLQEAKNKMALRTDENDDELPLDVSKEKVGMTNKSPKHGEGMCEDDDEDDEELEELMDVNRGQTESDWQMRENREDEDMLGPNSPRSMMDDEDADVEDDFMDELGSEMSETSREIGSGRILHHDGTSQPLPSCSSPLMRPRRVNSRHSAPPIAIFSSTTQDGMEVDDDDFQSMDDEQSIGNRKNSSANVMNNNCADRIGSTPRPCTDPLSNKPDVVSDPALYTPLLPKPGSNDNSWETLIEVTKSSETAKLQQLVDNIEHKLSDPNQCIVCHRVLSCKSALQMHYRTHTGERPFRCKICGRAFTTKGNLKTHMGVHRIKPPMRVLHQCPVCHRKFTNALVLQQHIKMHTGEPTEMTAEQIYAAEVKDFVGHPLPQTSQQSCIPPTSSSLNSSPLSLVLSPFAPPPPPPPLPATANNNNTQPLSPKNDANKPLALENTNSVIRIGTSSSQQQQQQQPSGDKDGDRKPAITTCTSSTPPLPMSSYSTSLAALENHVKTISTPPPSLAQFGHLMAVASGAILPPHHHHHSSHHQRLFTNEVHHPLAYISGPIHSLAKYRRLSDSTQQQANNNNGQAKDLRSTPSPTSSDDRVIKRETMSPNINNNNNSNVNNNNNSNSNNNNNSRNLVSVSRSPSPGSVSSMTNSEASMSSASALDLTPRSVITSSASLSPAKSLDLTSLPLHLQTPGRFSTTCTICFKTFACNSALEIHFRSHTKERPFKCGVCERAFSTKGNMKQHMLTHKIRDLPHQFFDPKSPLLAGNDVSHLPSTQKLPPPAAIPQSVTSHLPAATQQQLSGGRDNEERRRTQSPEHHHHHHHHRSSDRSKSDNKESSSCSRRSSSNSKHPCAVCHKCFSSASALMIHMRTHTGDKPFKCNVCERAFTTKGNLKVHMGTHMWNNGTSRRGRRMSIDLPPLSINPKDGEHLSRRSEHLFFPYIPSPFMNGMAAKMNEISVIQSAVLNNGYFGGSMGAGVVPTMVPTPTSAANDTGSATALRHTAELDLSCKKSPLHAEGACRSGSASAHSSPATSPAASGRSFDRSRSLGDAEDDRYTSEGSRSPTPIGDLDDRAAHRSSSSPSTPQSASETANNSSNWLQQWKMNCNTCNKVCHSPNELEDHLRIHYKDTKDAIMDMSNKTEGLQV